MRPVLVVALLVGMPLLGMPLLEATAEPPRRGLPQHPDIPPVAVEGYWAGQEAAPAGCVMPWWLLAGIGKVESDHGRYGGRTLQPDGRSQPPIVGIALDGSHGTLVILDTDGGRLDADPVFDRAVGPMQFIPSTWRSHAHDGDDDGTADPQDIHDAAPAASLYLCRARPGDFSVESHARTAVLAYNQSAEYVRTVLDHALRYRDEATHPTAELGPVVGGIVCPVAGPVSFIDSWGFPRSGGRTHKGQDLFAVRGTPLVALADATVLDIGRHRGLGGNIVWIGTGDGAAWYYAHLDVIRPGLQEGEHLRQGDPVGTVGTTGNARTTPPHLHIQWRPAGRHGADTNPYALLDAACPGH